MTNLPDPQDPLPEANWLWRRVFVFLALAFAFTILIGLGYAVNRIVGNVVNRIDNMDAVNVAQITVVALNVIMQMFRLMIYTVLVVVTYYMVAPSAEQITKMLQTARLLKAGVQITTKAAVRTPEREEQAESAAGKPPLPPADDAGEAKPMSVAPDTGQAAEALPDAPWATDDRVPPPRLADAPPMPRPTR